MILNWIKYNKPNNLNAVKCVNRELKNVKNKEFVSLFYKQCLNEELDVENIFDGIEIKDSADSENEPAKDLKEPLTSPCQGACKEPISKEVINNKQKIINNKQEVRSNKSADGVTPFNTYSTVLTFFEENIHPVGEAEREKLHMWSSVIDCDVIILAVEEALKYNARNINYVGRILQSWSRKGLKTAYDVKKYKNMEEYSSGKPEGKYSHYDFKELERKLLGWGDG